jgi:hypothetical protein
LPKLRIVGLDGFSERLRRMAGKPITRDMLRGFFRGLATAKVAPNHMKVYNIVGYPTETEADWFEFVEDLAAADEGWTKIDPQWGIEVHSTPFRPMPATPCACWPMSHVNYRGRIVKVLSRGRHREYKGIFYPRQSVLGGRVARDREPADGHPRRAGPARRRGRLRDCRPAGRLDEVPQRQHGAQDGHSGAAR